MRGRRRGAWGCGEESNPAISRNSARAAPMAAATLFEPLRRFAGSQRQARLRFGPASLSESMPSAGQGIALAVNQALDLKSHLDVAPPIKALAGSALVWLELGKLRLPEPQDVGLNFADAGDVANLEVEAIGDRGRFLDALPGELRGHSVGERRRILLAEALL